MSCLFHDSCLINSSCRSAGPCLFCWACLPGGAAFRAGPAFRAGAAFRAGGAFRARFAVRTITAGSAGHRIRKAADQTGQWNSTTTASRASALTSTSVASQSRSSFAARHKTYRLRSTLAQGFLSKPSKEPVGARKHNSSTSPLLEARHRRTSRRPDLARGRQPKTFNKLTQKLSACYGHARP